MRRAADHGRARAVGAGAERDDVGVAIDIADVFRIEAELLDRDLAEAGLVSLPLMDRAHQQRRLAAGIEAQLGEFRAGRGRALDRIGDAEAAQLAALLALRRGVSRSRRRRRASTPSP